MKPSSMRFSTIFQLFMISITIFFSPFRLSSISLSPNDFDPSSAASLLEDEALTFYFEGHPDNYFEEPSIDLMYSEVNSIRSPQKDAGRAYFKGLYSIVTDEDAKKYMREKHLQPLQMNYKIYIDAAKWTIVLNQFIQDKGFMYEIITGDAIR